MTDLNDNEFRLFKEYLLRVCGIDIPEEKRYLFKTRLGDFLEEEACRTFSELYNRLTTTGDKGLERRLVQAMTTHETSFFRDGHPFALLEKKLLPTITECKARDSFSGTRLRILSVGCSTGQEPYSIAMVVRQWLARQDVYTPQDVSILAVDISARVLAEARQVSYTSLQMGKFIPEGLVSRYFVRKQDHWEVVPEIRKMVRFAEVNLSEPFGHLGRFDLIFCRNVIIYFSLDLKRQILQGLKNMLLSGGALILGGSESLYGLSSEFRAVHEEGSTYYVVAS